MRDALLAALLTLANIGAAYLVLALLVAW